MLALRLPFAAVSGILFSLAVFLGLWQLVSVPFDVGDPVVGRIIDFTRQITPAPPENKRDPKIERTPPPVTPPIPGNPGWSTTDVTTIATFDPPKVDVLGPDRNGLPVGPDRDVLPLVRVAPDYPPRAIATGTEGWVQVQFTITPTGMVRDPVVVASEPGTLFDDAALKAVARWRYNPRVDGGVAVERVGIQALIRFELEQ